MKKIISLVLALVLCMVFAAPVFAESGTKGDVSYTVDNGVLTVTGSGVIPDSAFEGRKDITSVNIGEDITGIGKQAFLRCSSLKSIEMPEGVTTIGGWAFCDCEFLTRIELPRSVTAIGRFAFSNDERLTATIHRTGDTRIESDAFQRVPKLIVCVPLGWSGDKSGFNARNVIYETDMYGKGTAEDPYLISAPELLTQLAKKVAEGTDYEGKYFKLTENLEYNGAPIGKLNEGPFKGIFDGDGHTLTVNISTDDSCAALFVDTIGATIKNLEIKGTISGTESVGGVVGLARDNTLIDNCHVSATVTGSELNIGGIAGMLYNGSTVSNCRVDGTVKGRTITIGGIVGWLHGGSKVINCVKTGDTIGDSAVGGIAGYALGSNSAIINCGSFGKVTASAKCGGIVGLIKETDFGEVTESLKLYACYANCKIVSQTDCGYICGRNEYASASPVDAKELYYVMTGDKDAPGYQLPKTQRVTFINRTSVLNSLNTFVSGYGDATLTPWSKVAASICPASCQGFNLADVDTAPFTSDETVKSVTLDCITHEADGVNVDGTPNWNYTSWRLYKVYKKVREECSITVTVPENCAILSVTYHCFYRTDDDSQCPNVLGDYPISRSKFDCTVNIPVEDAVRTLTACSVINNTIEECQYVKRVTVKYCSIDITASTLSEGNIGIVCSIGAAAVIAVAALVIMRRKKKTVLASGAEKEDEE